MLKVLSCSHQKKKKYYLVIFLEKLLYLDDSLHTTLLSLLLWCNYFQRPATGIFTWINNHMNRTTKHVQKKIHKQKKCSIFFLFHILLLVLEQGKHICSSGNCSFLTSTPKSLPLHNHDIAYSDLLETKQKSKAII